MTDTTETSAPKWAGNAETLPAGVWPTRAARMVLDAIEVCRAAGDLGAVSGPSGIGKTTAAVAAVRAAADALNRAHYVRMTVTADGLQPGLVHIGEAIGAPVQSGMGAADARKAIVAAMAWWGAGDLLVIDEAQFMDDKLFLAVRDVADELQDRGWMPGIVLLGDRALADRINGKRGRQARDFEALRGRLAVAVDLPAPDTRDFQAISAAMGVAQPQAAELVARVGAGRGGLHNVARLLRTARAVAGPGNPVTLGALRTAAQVAGVAA